MIFICSECKKKIVDKIYNYIKVLDSVVYKPSKVLWESIAKGIIQYG